MDRDTITRTGARAPGVKRRVPLERRCTSAPRSSTQNEDKALQAAGCTKDGRKLHDAKNSWSTGQRRRRRNWVHATDELSGVSEGDRSIENGQRKLGTTHGSPRRCKVTHSEGSAYKPLCGEIALCR